MKYPLNCRVVSVLLLATSTSIALPPGKYRVAAVLDRSDTLLFYGEQTLQPGLKYSSNFVVPPN
jgi:hypothetical protein